MPRIALAAALLCLGLASPAATAAAAPTAPAAPAWQLLGFAQLTAEHSENGDGIDFGADRIRAGARYRQGAFGGGLVLDFNVPNAGQRTPGTFTNIIKDAYLDWYFAEHFRLRGGQFKTPIGMDFNTPGDQLDISKRALEKPLVLERDAGLMLSASELAGGIGFDLGVFNPAGRSGATAHSADQEGESNAWAARLRWDRGNFHAEASVGESAEAGGVGSQDYQVSDIAARHSIGRLSIKAEYIAGRDVLGVADHDQDVAYLHLGWQQAPQWQWVARHYQGQSEMAGAQTDLGNTYLGFNYWPDAGRQAKLRLQANWVIASGDQATYSGLGGYRDDALLIQAQLSFRHLR